ncbi:uncharacterized protein [Anabrus simplex]|uniref:uncharacterized protein n=1 Tax=Anabrus simplex TaxID=316456 RepID=UPI0035A3B4E9
MAAKITFSLLMLACLVGTLVHAMSVSVRQADNTEADTSASASSESVATDATAAPVTSGSGSSQNAATGATAAPVNSASGSSQNAAYYNTQTPDMFGAIVRIPFQIAQGVADTGINMAQNAAETGAQFAILPLRMFGNFFPMG